MGLVDLTEIFTNGQLEISADEMVFVFVSRADLRRLNLFPRKLERFLHTWRERGESSRMVFGGLFPAFQDSGNDCLKIQKIRRYAEDRLSAEDNIKFCRSGERFMSSDGINDRYLCETGLTDLGARVLWQDLVDVVKSWERDGC